MSEKLKPCPFCGSEMEYSEDGGYLIHSIYTDSCPLSGPTRIEYLEAWNNRPTEKAAEDKRGKEVLALACEAVYDGDEPTTHKNCVAIIRQAYKERFGS